MAKLADNLHKAEGFLARFRRDGVLNHINGVAVPAQSGLWFETLSPVDLQPLAQVARGDAADIDAAAAAAKAAFAGWAAMAGDARRDMLHAIADAIEARADEIALIEAMDTGQSIRFMAKAALRGARSAK
jgi:5-carboxymethyl-2-hydroxymuconic-semialdehyde dehydrogenase